MKLKSKRELTNLDTKISYDLKRPQQKFIYQIIYGILTGNKVHLSEIARSRKENITLKKTIDRLSRNLYSFTQKQTFLYNYPIWLNADIQDFKLHDKTLFTQDDFIESIDFVYPEIHMIKEDLQSGRRSPYFKVEFIKYYKKYINSSGICSTRKKRYIMIRIILQLLRKDQQLRHWLSEVILNLAAQPADQ